MGEMVARGMIRKGTPRYEEHLISIKCISRRRPPGLPSEVRWIWYVAYGSLRLMAYRDSKFRLVGEPVIYEERS